MRIGAVIPQNEIGTDPDGILRWARTVERLGFVYLDIFDHVLGADVTDRPDWPGPYTHEHRFHEPFMLLAHLCGQVDLDLATGVLVLPQRQTALVAKQAAELDLLSRGRLRLGVGIGWNPVEAEALGTDFADRARRYEEQIVLLRRLWTEPVVDFDGTHHRIDRAGIAPLPVQRPIPVWLGGSAPAALDRVGRLADGWIAWDPTGAGLDDDLARIRGAAREAGRDPDRIGLQGRIDVHGPIQVDRFRRALRRWEDAGADHLSIHLAGQGPVDAHVEALEQISDLLVPHLRPKDSSS